MRTLFCSAILAAALCGSTLAAPLPLSRGVGIHEWLNWSPLAANGAYRWPPYRSETEWLAAGRSLDDWPEGNPFERIAALGFDFVRLSVDPGPLLDSQGARRQEALGVLETALLKITSSGLRVVFNLHGVSQVPAYSMDTLYDGADSEGVAQYRAMVTDVAAMLTRVGPDKVALEPYNEPAYYPCDAGGGRDWQQIMAATLADIRAVSTELTVVATGACGGGVAGLVDLVPDFDDANIYYSFHMYEPQSFTHQRAGDPTRFHSGLPWPADRASAEAVIAELRRVMNHAGLDVLEQAANIALMEATLRDYFAENWGESQLQARLGEAVAWARSHGIPESRLFMGEFGAMLMSVDGRSGARNADRLRYLAALRREAERFSIPWSVWEYSNPYGMSLVPPTGPAEPDADMLDALGL